jgi:hypothetical protein
MIIPYATTKRVCRYQRGNQTDNTTTKRKKRKEQTTIDKISAQKAKDQAAQTSIKTGGELRCCSGRVGSSYSTSGTRRVTITTTLHTKTPLCIAYRDYIEDAF